MTANVFMIVNHLFLSLLLGLRVPTTTSSNFKLTVRGAFGLIPSRSILTLVETVIIVPLGRVILPCARVRVDSLLALEAPDAITPLKARLPDFWSSFLYTAVPPLGSESVPVA